MEEGSLPPPGDLCLVPSCCPSLTLVPAVKTAQSPAGWEGVQASLGPDILPWACPPAIRGASRTLDQPPGPGLGVVPHPSGSWTTLESCGIFPLHTFKIISGIRLQHPHYIPDRWEGDTGDGGRGMW